MNPDFDFQLTRNRRLRGWGWRGLTALGIYAIFAIATMSLCLAAIWLFYRSGASWAVLASLLRFVPEFR